MVHEGCRHRRSRLDSTSVCNHSIPESRGKNCERVVDLTGMKVLIDYREVFARTRKNRCESEGRHEGPPSCIFFLPFALDIIAFTTFPPRVEPEY